MTQILGGNIVKQKKQWFWGLKGLGFVIMSRETERWNF